MDSRTFQRASNPDINFAATISGTDCKADEYKLTPAMEGVSIDATGKVTVDTSVARAAQTLKLSVKSGVQLIVSKPFKFEVFDCVDGFSFPNLQEKYIL